MDHKFNAVRGLHLQALEVATWCCADSLPAHSIAYSGYRPTTDGRPFSPISHLYEPGASKAIRMVLNQLESRVGEQTTADLSRTDSLSAKTSNWNEAARHVCISVQQRVSAVPGTTATVSEHSLQHAISQCSRRNLQEQCEACRSTWWTVSATSPPLPVTELSSVAAIKPDQQFRYPGRRPLPKL